MRSLPDRSGAAGGPEARASGAAAPEWVEVAVEVVVGDADQAVAVLEGFAPSGAAVRLPFEQDATFGPAAIPTDGLARVSVYLPAPAWPGMEEAVRGALERAAWSGPGPRLEIAGWRREEWDAAWQAWVQITRAGRLVIRPLSKPYTAQPGEVVVDFAPGLAFGTGQHESTRMALEAVEGVVRPGDRVLDFGCGSGILACAAAALGAAQVDACDIDPLAVEATRRNAALNHAAERVHVKQRETPPAGPYDVVVANMTASTLAQHAAALAAATRAGGWCVLGGLVEAQRERLSAAVARTPLQIVEVRADGDWRTLYTTRPASLPG